MPTRLPGANWDVSYPSMRKIKSLQLICNDITDVIRELAYSPFRRSLS